ncbi:MAG: BatA domain-containing protein [Bacteroidales bacterium]|nr:BatA domain-containing protein [Bacteroidales bacterium]
MQFINPFFLFASFLIIIPVIIHLFNFRSYKKEYFSDTKFLKEIIKKTKKTSQLRHYLILASRIIAILSLVFAFSQPYIPKSENHNLLKQRNIISVYIDNSFSMEVNNESGKLIEQAKEKAKEIAAFYKNTDMFCLLTNDFESKHRKTVTKEEFLSLIDEVKISSSFKSLTEIFSKQTDFLSNFKDYNHNIFIISDLQKKFIDASPFKLKDTISEYFFIPLDVNKTANLFIDSCWFDNPVKRQNMTTVLSVRIVNNSEIDYEKVPVKLYVNNNQKALASFNISAGTETIIKIPYKITEKGFCNGSVELTDFPIVFDNKFYFSYTVINSVSILSINESDKNLYLSSLFSSDSVFVVNNVDKNKIDFTALSANNLIILNSLISISSGLSQELTKFIEKGGSLLVLPSDKIDIESYRAFLTNVSAPVYKSLDTVKTKISYINTNSYLFNDVFEQIPKNADLPKISNYYLFSSASNDNSEILLAFENDNVFLSLTKFRKGKIYLFAAPFDSKSGNFQTHPLFVPTLYKIGLFSSRYFQLYYTIGKDEAITFTENTEARDNAFFIKSTNSGFNFIPEIRSNLNNTVLFTHNRITEAGAYNLYLNNDLLQSLAFNYNRNESILEYYDLQGLKDILSKSGLKNYRIFDNNNKAVNKALSDFKLGMPLNKLFIILALFFLLLEIVFLRYKI